MKEKGEKIIKKREGELKEQTKKFSIKEGISYSVMDGAGLRYITPYALSIGANNAQIGLLTSIPSLLGNFFQIFSSRAIEKHSRKKIIFSGVLLQALMWLPILFIGYLFFYKNVDHGLSATLMIIFFTLLTIFGAVISPAWNSLMKDNLGKESGRYFGKRNKIIGIITLAVMLFSGLLLHYFQDINLFLGFAILFGTAFFARLVSCYFISRHYEPKLKLKDGYYFGFFRFVSRIPYSNFAKFAVFVSLITLATAIASPFFTVYLLKDLNLNYLIWTIITLSNPLGTLLFMPFWGKIICRFGNLKVLRWTGLLIPVIPLLYFLTMFRGNTNILIVAGFLFITEFFSGFAWAGFNLSSVTFIYDAVSKSKIALCVAYYSVLSGIGVFIGATLGGFIASMKFNFFGISPILFIFLLSAVLRFVSYLFMMPKLKEVRKVEVCEKGEFKREIKTMIFPFNNKLGRGR